MTVRVLSPRQPLRGSRGVQVRRPFRAQAIPSGRLTKPVAATIVAPEKEVDSSTRPDEGWTVTVFNNETNTYEEVMTILQIATGCDVHEAYIETWEVDHYGQCVVHRADEASCTQAAEIIRTIGIRVEAGPA